MFEINNGTEKKRVAIYCRVSTDEQVQNGNGLEIQEEALRKFVEMNSHQFILRERNVYIDEGKSGADKEKEDRPALYKMFEAAERGEFEVLLVWKFDRLFRKILYLLESIEALDKLNIGFISTTQNFDTTTPMGKMILSMFGMMAELERDTIRERTQAGILSNMKKGKWGRGYYPYGYKKGADGYMELVPDEVEVIKMIFTMIAEEGATMNQVITKLNNLGIDTSSSKGKLGKKRKENLKHKNHWHRTSVQRIVTNEMYTGTLIQNRYKQGRKDKVRVERPKEEWIITECPKVIEKEIFIQAQKQIEKNRRYSRRNKKEGVVYMLSTLLYDKETNYKYSGYLSSKKTKNYRVDIKNKSKEYVRPKGISGAKIENAVWEKLETILSHPRMILNELEVLNQRNNGRDAESEIEQLKTEKWKNERAIKGFLAMLVDPKHEDSYDYINSMISEKRERILNISTEIENLEKLIMTEEEKLKQLHDLSELSLNLVGHIKDITYEEKTEICRILVEQVLVDDKNLEITLLIPTSESKRKVRERKSLISDVFKEENTFLSEIQKNSETTFDSRVSKLCYNIGRGRETRTHNPTVPNRVR